MRLSSRGARLGAVVASLVLVVAACSSDSDGASDEPATDDTTTEEETATAVAPEDNGGRTEGDGTLVIGAVLPQSGNLAALGPAMIEAGAMAVRDINDAGGVNGADIEYIVMDDGGAADDDLALTSANELINNENVDAIYGAAGSGTTKTILDTVVSSGTVECSPSNTGADLTEAPDEGLYFRTPPADNLQAQALAKAVSDDGHQSVAIVAQNTDYGTGFIRFLEPALDDSGVDVATTETYDELGTSFETEVENVVASEPEAVVLIGYPEDGAKVLSEMIEQGAGPGEVPIYVTDGMADSELYTQIDESDPAITAGIRGTAASVAPEAGAAFFPDAFAEFAPEVESPIYSAQGYDCIVLMALAAVKTGSDAPYDIALEMGNISRGEGDDAEVCTTFADCIALLDEGADINYDGASGALDFSEYGEPSAGSFDVYTFGDDGATSTDEQIVVGG